MHDNCRLLSLAAIDPRTVPSHDLESVTVMASGNTLTIVYYTAQGV